MINKIKTLHIDTERGWRGGQQQAIYLFESMVKSGFETMFVCRPNSKLTKYLKAKKLPFFELKMSTEFDIVSAYKIAKFCRKNNYNILHLHSGHAQSIGILAKFFYRKLKTISSRRVDFGIKQNFFSKFKYKTKLLDKIVCISGAIKNVLLNDGIDENKLTIIHSGINIKKFDSVIPLENFKQSLNIPKENIVIGTISALVGHKDYPNLLNAAKIVLEKKSNITFCAVGDGKNEKEIKELYKKLKLGENFIFTGYRNDVGQFLKMFDIFVMASKKEGLGTSILDAQAVGLPIVATKTGGIPEIVKNNVNGLLVEPQNFLSLANAIIELIEDKEKRLKLGKTALETVRNFDINITVEKNIGLYKKIL